MLSGIPLQWVSKAEKARGGNGGLTAQVNMGGLLAWEFLLFHWVEVRRWQDIRKKDSVNEVRCNSSSMSGFP